MRPRIAVLGMLVVALTAALAFGVATANNSPGEGVATYVVRSVEDPDVPYDPTACTLPAANRTFPARLLSLATRASDGRVVNEEVRQVGTASACAQITSLAPGASVDFAIRFDLPAGSFGGKGACRVASNDVPVGNVVLAGCSIRLTNVPDGFVGGVAGSASVLAPPDTGVQTGSFWTLRVYEG